MCPTLSLCIVCVCVCVCVYSSSADSGHAQGMCRMLSLCTVCVCVCSSLAGSGHAQGVCLTLSHVVICPVAHQLALDMLRWHYHNVCVLQHNHWVLIFWSYLSLMLSEYVFSSPSGSEYSESITDDSMSDAIRECLLLSHVCVPVVSARK